MLPFLKIYIAFFIIGLIILRVWMKPEELIIYALIISSTFPSLVDGNILSVGQKHFFIRFEYILPALGFFLVAISENIRCTLWTTLEKAVLLMFMVHVASVPIAIYWGTPFGIGVSVRLLETFFYFFIIVKLTDRTHIPRLVHAFIGVGAIIAFVLLLMSVTGSPIIYKIITGGSMGKAKLCAIGGQLFGQQIGWLNYSIHALPVVGSMVLLLFFIKERHKLFYGILYILFLVYLISCGQRRTVIGAFLGFSFVLIFLFKAKFINSRFSFNLIAVLAIMVAISALFYYSDILGARVDLLFARSENFTDQIAWQDSRQYMGHVLAMERLHSSGLLGWLVGYSGFESSQIGGLAGYDISSPIFVIYRYGIIGIIVLILLLTLTLRQACLMLKNVRMIPEEIAVVFGVILYISLCVPMAFFRATVFAANFNKLSWFVILLGWMHVIHRDYAFQNAGNDTPVISESMPAELSEIRR